MRQTSIKQYIQDMAQQDMPCVVQGIATSTDPLQITLVNDISVVLSAVSLMVPSRLQPIEEGDLFYMLKVNRGRSYYILDRW